MGRFNLLETDIKDLKVIRYEPFYDERGYFFEAYNKKEFANLGINDDFVQDNQDYSKLYLLYFEIEDVLY